MYLPLEGLLVLLCPIKGIQIPMTLFQGFQPGKMEIQKSLRASLISAKEDRDTEGQCMSHIRTFNI